MPEEDLYNFYTLTHEQDVQLQAAIAAVTSVQEDVPAENAPAEGQPAA